VIRKRLEAYEQQTRPVLEYYLAVGRQVVAVDASNDPPPRIFQKIRYAMDLDDCTKDSR
jgi:adenylate kinase family enzyme